MNPLFRLEAAEGREALPESMIKKIRGRVKYVYEGVSRVEKASGLTYLPYYIEPVLSVSTSAVEVGQLGVLYARTLPLEGIGGLQIWVQLSAPLVAFGSKGTVHAVLAHEFMHYVELVRKFTKLDIHSDEAAGTLHESLYADYERLYEPKLLFRDRGLIKLLESRFSDGLADDDLERKTVNEWIEKKLPTVRLPPDANRVKLSISSILSANFDPILKSRLEELEKMKAARNGRRR